MEKIYLAFHAMQILLSSLKFTLYFLCFIKYIDTLSWFCILEELDDYLIWNREI